MKKLFFSSVGFVCLFMVIVSADFRTIPYLMKSQPEVNPCVGYTIVEFDKAISCNGDTIRLVRRHGYAEPLR